MQFIPNGPDIPDELLQAHEEGKVVFFCGAGISYPAGLPGFGGLVQRIYTSLGATPSILEKEALKNYQFDAALDLLERRIPGQRYALRKALADSLKPQLRRKGAIDTQQALLTLAKDRKDTLRLVTTNFDYIFESAAKKLKINPLNTYSAPMLPIPKKAKWDGLVYLHGKLPKSYDEASLNRLVITSGDFGLAYLTERWASRFVSELFRNYIVCFVGYSINDPVMKYMMDAIAADRMLGENTPEAWAFTDSKPSDIADTRVKWKAKGVNPIIYKKTADHSLLHQTLHAWAKTYQHRVSGKQNIVISNVLAKPSGSTQQDNFVGRMLWALSDPSGEPAKTFADYNPVPSLEWLFKAFLDDRYAHKDLQIFGITPNEKADDKLVFNFVNRPTPYHLAPKMSLLSGYLTMGNWDKVMYQIARWLLRHLNDPQLILWVSRHAGKIHPSFVSLMNYHLSDLDAKSKSVATDELNEIVLHAPNAIPDEFSKKLWRLILSGNVQSSSNSLDLYDWKRQFLLNGATKNLKLTLREILAPKIVIKEKFSFEKSNDTDSKSLIDVELNLNSDHVHSELVEFEESRWKEELPSFFEEFQLLLKDGLDLLKELEKIDHKNDFSDWHLPSIEEHPQNRNFHNWTALIELLRDSWLKLNEIDNSKASTVAQYWFKLEYPVFKRLALFAASKGSVEPSVWLEWLLSDSTWWLWAPDTKREVLRLLVLQGHQLSGELKEELESTIIKGPPREMYKDGLDVEKWNYILNHSVWLHLSKLESSGLRLGKDASGKLDDLSKQYPDWKLAEDERDEFSVWMSSGWRNNLNNDSEFEEFPTKRAEIVKRLTSSISEESSADNDYENRKDNWVEICTKHPMQALFALKDLAEKDIWPLNRWKQAFQTWGNRRFAKRVWMCGAPFIQNIPDHLLKEVIHSFCRWMEEASKATDCHNKTFIALCEQVLEIYVENTNDDAGDNPVFDAINHPVGVITETLINLWLHSKPNDNENLPKDFLEIFTRLARVEHTSYRHGRVILAANLIPLYRVDKLWAETHLLPLFDWDHNEAKNVWEGFLWSPRMYAPLLISIKEDFLETARHYSQLGEHKNQYVRFLTYVALNDLDGYALSDFVDLFDELPQEALNEAADALVEYIKAHKDQSEEYWKSKVAIFWREVWPKNKERISLSIAESVAEILVLYGDDFSSSFETLRYWLKPLKYPYRILNDLAKSQICEKYPLEALDFISLIIDKEDIYSLDKLQKCLKLIAQSNSEVVNSSKYMDLLNLVNSKH